MSVVEGRVSFASSPGPKPERVVFAREGRQKEQVVVTLHYPDRTMVLRGPWAGVKMTEADHDGSFSVDIALEGFQVELILMAE